jgi:hypothetical protein
MNKDIYKNPLFYYVLVPVIVALWPLLVWAVYIPQTERKWENEKKNYEQAKQHINKILNIDKERLEYSSGNTVKEEFDYVVAIDKIARKCGIPASKYTISSKPARRTADGQKTQSAMISLDGVSIKTLSEFLSTITLRWANLQCERIKIDKQKGLDDIWDVDMDLKYFF